MDNQILESSGRSRTYWTTTMERYFIDLMIEQMHRGNRMGHTFNKQAWIDMLTVFNANFGSHYDKDALKSRYTNLWKQFNDVKNLLGQNGFSWDETRQMVVADDFAWDAYLKVHPEARSYRTKSVLNFDDLCLIYGYTVADGRYSRSSHDVDFDDEVQGVNVAVGMSNQQPSASEHTRTDWTPSMDQYFIELMLDQVGRGNKSGDTFTKQAWMDMLHLFNERFGSQHGKRVLRHRYKKLLKYYSDATVILEQDGFSWDEVQQMIIAADDAWDAYVKVNPHVRTYRTKIIPNYNDLVRIYGNASDNGIQSQVHQGKVPEDDSMRRKRGRAGSTPTGDRTRTYWTPPMDRYLIDLQLDQVLKGNKVGQTFITQAWTEMIMHFNTNFQSNYEKDVLKNRYKHLRKQFNEIRNILKEDGFSWDEAKEMVTAKDQLWDAYIKEHPDARAFRVRTLPNYNKLCVMFGEESLHGRYNSKVQNTVPGCEKPVLMTGAELHDPYSTKTESSTVEWTDQRDRYFSELLLEMARRGNNNGSTFDDLVWFHMVTSFNKEFGVQCCRSDLHSRYVFLRKQHEEISNLLSHSGFAWDEDQQMVHAEHNVWEAFIKEHPDASAYRERVLGCYNILRKIRTNVVDASFISPDVEICSEPDAPRMEQLGGAGSPDGQSSATFGHMQVPYQQEKRPATPPQECEVDNKVQKTEQIQGARSDIAGEISKLASEPKGYTIEGAICALQAISDIDDDLLLDACDLLEDEKKAKTFLALDASLRKKWLLRKLRP